MSELNKVESGIAVIGMAGRFPGADTLPQFWNNLKNGIESIQFFREDELEISYIDSAPIESAHYIKARGVLNNVDMFDAGFFNINPREAAIMDPQHRLFLECASEALEHSGYVPANFPGVIGVIAGSYHNTYLLNNLYSNPTLLELVGTDVIMHGNAHDHLATHLSYKLNLTGPSFSVQTACSSSLVAIHLACQQLLNGESDMVLAGGVCVSIPEKSGYLYQEGGILSPDGHCRAFDASAAGTVFGNGLGIVVLKRLDEALAAGDFIHAVIKGSAINNDGAAKVGYMAPSPEGQSAVIAEALAVSEVPPETIRYIETHGTGTAIGDAIEIAALTSVYEQHTEKRNFCGIGSVKTNIGHLSAASGVAGLIKTILAMQHKTIPPTLNVETPNPNLNLATSPFYINSECTDWPDNSYPRRAGLSSFGVGGTNAHLILEEAPMRHALPTKSPQLIVLSGKTALALEKITENLSNYLQSPIAGMLSDVAFTLQVGRAAFEHRRMVVCCENSDAVQRLVTGHITHHLSQVTEQKIVFMFSGQGSQYVNMALGLYQQQPIFRQHVDYCSEQLRECLGLDLRTVLYPATEITQLEQATQALNQTALAQPALFVIEYALAKLWISWGIEPAYMIGHSIGEYVAACLAGVFSLNDALKLVAARGRLMQELTAGAMLSVALSAQEVAPFLTDTSLCIAAINTSTSCVVSGESLSIAHLQTHLNELGISHQLLHTSHAFHSHMMDGMLEEYMAQVSAVDRHSPQIPYVSNLTGKIITNKEVMSPRYWVDHLRHSVLFADGLSHILGQNQGDTSLTFLEIGPSNALSTFAQHAISFSDNHAVHSSLRHPKSQDKDEAFILTALGQLWLKGAIIHWEMVHADERCSRIPLPTYPFERKSHWIDPKQPTVNVKNDELLGKKQNVLDWFYLPSWKQLALPFNAHIFTETNEWLVFEEKSGLSEKIIQCLIDNRQSVTRVTSGEQWIITDSSCFVMNPQLPEHYTALMDKLIQENKCPTKIIHLLGVTENTEQLRDNTYADFQRLILLAQALGKLKIDRPIALYVLTNNMQEVTGQDLLHPEKAVILGPCRVIGQEYAEITCSSIDVELPASMERSLQLVKQLMMEFTATTSEPVVAYRQQYRWVQTFSPWQLKPLGEETPLLRKNGVYLITGGLGGVGLTLANYLAKTCQATLILIGRSEFPVRDEWSNWLAREGFNNKTSDLIKQLMDMEACGATVCILRADVTQEKEMQKAVEHVRATFGGIHGVIHAAGIAGGGLIQAKTTSVSVDVLNPKVQGAMVLHQLFHESKLDFLLFCSSINSILSAVGQVDYCSANAFLDSYAHYVRRVSGMFAVSVNWDTWQEVGMAVNTSVPAALRDFRDESLQQGILPEEAQEVFRYVLAGKLPQIIVSTQHLPAVIQQHQNVTLSSLEAGLPVENEIAATGHVRPNLTVAYVAPSNEIEWRVTAIWEDLLGIEGIGVEDNFFDLGGHSLLASQILARLRELFGIELSLDMVFNMPTISDMAIVVEDKILEEIEGS